MVEDLNSVLKEWQSKTRRMGCVSAAKWFCRRVPSFKPERVKRYTKDGEVFEHVVCTDGIIRIDLAPYADQPRARGNHV